MRSGKNGIPLDTDMQCKLADVEEKLFGLGFVIDAAWMAEARAGVPVDAKVMTEIIDDLSGSLNMTGISHPDRAMYLRHDLEAGLLHRIYVSGIANYTCNGHIGTQWSISHFESSIQLPHIPTRVGAFVDFDLFYADMGCVDIFTIFDNARKDREPVIKRFNALYRNRYKPEGPLNE